MTLHPDHLAEEARLLRRLAHQLIPDPEAAEDASQSVALAWLEKRPQGLRSPRAWLIGALRLERLKWLGGRSRRIVEDTDPEQLGDTRPTGSDPANRELRDLIESETLALREPYASVLRASLFEERSLDAIARDLGRRYATVRSQHTRGLELLRQRLDSRLEGRDAWIAVLIPWRHDVGGGALSAARTASSRGLGSGLSWLTVTATISGLLLWVLTSDRDLPREAPASLAGTVDSSSTTPAPTGLASSDAARRVSQRVALPGVDASEEPSAPLALAGSRRLRIRAIDEDGLPVSGASVVHSPIAANARAFGAQEPPATVEVALTDERGEATMEFPSDLLEVGQDGRLLAPLKVRRVGYMSPVEYQMSWDPDPTKDSASGVSTMLLWRAPLDVVFHAVDDVGEQLEGVSVAIETAAPIDVGPLVEGMNWGRAGYLLESRGDQPPGFPYFAPGPYIVAVHSHSQGVTMQRVELRDSGPCTIRFGARRVVRGKVFDGSGRQVPGAAVWFERDAGLLPTPWAWRSTTTDARGEYELVLGDSSRAELWAARPEDPTAAVSRLMQLPAGVREDLDFHLRDDAPIQLQVVDDRERPLVNWNVRIRIIQEGNQSQVVGNTDDAGRVTFSNLRQGRLDLGVYGPQSGRLPARLRMSDFQVRAGEQRLVVEAARSEPSAILGQISTPAWSPPVPFAIVAGEPGSPAVELHQVEDAGAPFAIEGVPAGTVVLTALSMPSLAADLGEFHLPSGSFVDLGEIVLPPPGTVRFVADPPGSIEPSIVQTHVVLALQRDFPPRVAALSHWPADPIGLLPGTYRATLLDAQSTRLRAEFTIRSNETTVVTITR